jgi:hypothetical protein
MTPHPLVRLTFALLLAFLLALPVCAQAETGEVPPPPDRNPARVQAAPVAEAPVLPGDAPTVTWTDAEVADAKRDCAKKLAGLALDYEALPPIKEGICGAPAPILVKSVGGVAIDPAATMTCALASGLSTWLDKTLQPQAKAILGTQVVKLHNATSYACRNRYGGETTPLSEHALANALDISEFVFETGEKVTVLGSWPRVAAVPPPVPQANPTRVAADTTGSIAPSAVPRPQANEVVEVTKAKVSAKTNPFVLPTAVAKLPPPAPPAEATPPEDQSLSARKGDFVKTVHDDACQTFGTVLGPEANEAHKNHFHLDMKARRRTAFCQ